MVAGRAMKASIEPAEPLVLTRDQHATLGELVEIMGLLEHLLIRSVERVDPLAAKEMRKSLGGEKARCLWSKAISGRVSDARIATLIPVAEKELEEVAQDRNDFVHALFEGDYAKGYFQPGYQATSAIRSKTGVKRSTDDLQNIRDRAAKLSCLIAQIENAVP
jgi:hypothetical protein